LAGATTVILWVVHLNHAAADRQRMGACNER